MNFLGLIPGQVWEDLLLKYKNIFSSLLGSLFEKIVKGGEVGELNGKIIGQQFKDLKFGDRFFYSHHRDKEKQVPGIGEKLKNNVFGRTLSGIICDILPVSEDDRWESNMVKMPENVFRLTKYENWHMCGDILDNQYLDLEEIIEEIIAEDYFSELSNG